MTKNFQFRKQRGQAFCLKTVYSCQHYIVIFNSHLSAVILEGSLAIFRSRPKEISMQHHMKYIESHSKHIGLVRELNPGPLAPEARIIPLDQRATSIGRISFIKK